MSEVAEIIPEIRVHNAADTGEKRSRVSSGRSLLHGVDGRTRAARRYRDIVDSLILEFDISDESDMALVRTFADLSAWCEVEQSKAARGEPSDAERMIRSANTLRRLKNALVISSRARKRKNEP